MEAIMLSNVTDRILERLGSANVQDLGSLWCLKDQLLNLQNSISSIKAVLADAEDHHFNEDEIKGWVYRLEGPIYAFDNLLDDVSAEALRQMLPSVSQSVKKVRTFFSPSQLHFRLKVDLKIKEIEKKLARVKNDKRYQNLKPQSEQVLVESLETRVPNDQILSLMPDIEEIIGRKEDEILILQLLLNTNTEENLSVIPIVGTGGLGKTTLAQLVFNAEMVQEYFQLKIWVYVSDVFNLRLILEKIITCVTNQSPEGLEIEELQALFRREIKGKRYLLVLDDMWNDVHDSALDGHVLNDPIFFSEQEKWLSLKNLLTSGGWGSKVIITSRSHKVAQITASLPPYHLRVLDQDESWTLFKRKAFNRGQRMINSNTIELGKVIAERGKGIALIIRALGSMLFYKDPEKEWPFIAEEKVHSKTDQMVDALSDQKEKSNRDEVSGELDAIQEDNEEGAAEGQTEKEEKDNALQILKLCYDHLPQCLKPCFAYCRLFPKHHVIDVRGLVSLWMAQGFIKTSNPNDYMEDVGYEYFFDLLQRSFFLIVEVDEEDNKVTRCKMHHLMHDLAILVAGVHCVTADSNVENINTRRTHHLSFDFNLDQPKQILNLLVNGRRTEIDRITQVRKVGMPTVTKTLLLPGKEWWWKIPPREKRKQRLCRIKKKLDNTTSFVVTALRLKFLRVLDLHDLGIKMVPDSIGELKYLRYIDLSRNYSVLALPDSLCKLHYLQTLKLNRCENLLELPRDIKKLVSLRHLEIDGCYNLIHMPRGLSQLTDLQTLSKFVLSKGTTGCVSKHAGKLDELMRLNNLRGELKITNLRSIVDFEVANLKEKQYLSFLMLYWDKEGDVDADKEAEIALESLQPHSNLKGLTLCGYGGVSIAAGWLSSLTNLSKFKLYGCTKTQYLSSLHQFHSLKELILNKLPALEFFFDKDDAFLTSSTTLFPSLQYLQLCNLPNLEGWSRQSLKLENSVASITKRPLFSRLFELVVNNCPKLVSLPDGLENLNSLQRLEITDCHILLRKFQREVGDEWARIAHIPKIVFY